MKTFNLQENRILHVGPNKSEYDYVVKMINPSVYDRVALSKNEIVNLPKDIAKNSLKQEYYDLVIIWHVLEHIKDDVNAIKNLFSSLRYGGKILVSVLFTLKEIQKQLRMIKLMRKNMKKSMVTDTMLDLAV